MFCNCDDPYESNFFQYFVLNFGRLKLKKLIATCYAGSPIAGQQLMLFEGPETERTPYKAVVTKVYDKTGDDAVDMRDVRALIESGEIPIERLQGDGDFRSAECIELLKEADIVVTNPPFSLFREYVAQLVEYNKKFLIIGNKNALTYKEIFPLIKANKMWVGCTPMGKDMHFISPDHYITDLIRSGRNSSYVVTEEKILTRSPSIWFTNLDHKKRHESLILFRRYNSEEYPHYDNYDAIEVSKTVDIPCDYDGVMGVPITFLDKYNPEQFEIIGASESEGKGFSCGLWNSSMRTAQPMVHGRRLYKRLFIRPITSN